LVVESRTCGGYRQLPHRARRTANRPPTRLPERHGPTNSDPCTAMQRTTTGMSQLGRNHRACRANPHRLHRPKYSNFGSFRASACPTDCTNFVSHDRLGVHDRGEERSLPVPLGHIGWSQSTQPRWLFRVIRLNARKLSILIPVAVFVKCPSLTVMGWKLQFARRPRSSIARIHLNSLRPLARQTGQVALSAPLHWAQDGLPAGVCFFGRSER